MTQLAKKEESSLTVRKSLINALNSEVALKWVLFFGIFYRFFIFIFLNPTGNDRHDIAVHFYLANWKIPISDGAMGFHPPLYHLLCAPWMAIGGEKCVQFFSTILSSFCLYLIYRFIKDENNFPDKKLRLPVLALPAVLPAFILFGGVITNDALSYPIACLLYLQTLTLSTSTTWRHMLVLAVLLGFGLLTKGTFLAFIPIVGLTVLMSWWRKTHALTQVIRVGIIFGLLSGTIGCFKFAQNQIHFGRPIVHNQDFDNPWIERQRPTWMGWQKSLNMNVWNLVEEPHIHEANKHSLPLLFYGTFWHPLYPESSFRAVGYWTAHNLNQLIFLAGVPLTLLILLGFFRRLIRLLTYWRFWDLDEMQWKRFAFDFNVIGIWLVVLALVCIAGLKYDTYTCFQSRLLFPAMLSIVAFLYEGIRGIIKIPMAGYATSIICMAPFLLVIARIVIEIQVKWTQ